jgi:hypothetical protein
MKATIIWNRFYQPNYGTLSRLPAGMNKTTNWLRTRIPGKLAWA